MRCFIALSIVLLLGQLAVAHERYDLKAFRVTAKLCMSCHGTPFYLAKQHDEEEWRAFFEGSKLLEVHKGNAKALDALRSKRFKHYRKRLLKFFMENSKYSGVVHGCDANFCGTHK